MKAYRYQLAKDKNGRNQQCPNCKQKKYTRYVDTQTNDLLPEEYGICSRKDKCQYYLNPYHGGDNSYAHQIYIGRQDTHHTQEKTAENQKPAFTYLQNPIIIPNNIVEASLQRYEENNFVKFLMTLAPYEQVMDVCQKYKIGTSKYEKWGGGATIFWLIDETGTTRFGQVKKFNAQTGKTIKVTHQGKTKALTTSVPYIIQEAKGENAPQWVKDYFRLDTGYKMPCFFGQHLLSEYPNHTVCLVESPKNAILCELLNPKKGIIYSATMSMDSFNNKRGQMKPYTGRKILLLPDLGEASEKWRKKAEEILSTGSYQFLEILEKYATEDDRFDGLDIADFLIREAQNQFSILLEKLHFQDNKLMLGDKPAINYLGKHDLQPTMQQFITDIIDDFDANYLKHLQILARQYNQTT